jgi:hypothetical protein
MEESSCESIRLSASAQLNRKFSYGHMVESLVGYNQFEFGVNIGYAK